MFKNIPKTDLIAPTIPQEEINSEKYLIQDLNNLPKGTYYLLFIKGTNTYEKDLKYAENWINKNAEIIINKNLKSASLYKIKI